MPVNPSDLRKTLLEVILNPTTPPEDKVQAQSALDKLNNKSEPAPALEPITGPVKIGDLTVSESYACVLRVRHGSFGTKAAKEASGERLRLAAMGDKEAFLLKFPESVAFFDDAAEKIKALYKTMNLESAKIKAEQEAAKRPPAVQPCTPVERVEQPAADYPPPPELGPAQRALALRSL